jgi:predicted nuclease of predicted toxin-antitoxin system
LVTRDEDFVRLSLTLGAPPKLVWLNVGNRSNREVLALLRDSQAVIEHLAVDEEATVLQLGFASPGAA